MRELISAGLRAQALLNFKVTALSSLPLPKFPNSTAQYSVNSGLRSDLREASRSVCFRVSTAAVCLGFLCDSESSKTKVLGVHKGSIKGIELLSHMHECTVDHSNGHPQVEGSILYR
ncbi:hypothetical protein ABKN59_010842 [Abortiporus biennis]